MRVISGFQRDYYYAVTDSKHSKTEIAATQLLVIVEQQLAHVIKIMWYLHYAATCSYCVIKKKTKPFVLPT